MMKIVQDNSDQEKTAGAHGRMGGRFYVKPFELHDRLAKLGNLNCYYDCILRHAVIDEDWETNTVWVLGRFLATPEQFSKWTGKGKSYSRILLNKLVRAEIILMAPDGSFQLPMFKKKQDAGVRASDIQLLREKIEELETIVSEVLVTGKIPIPADSGKSPEEKKSKIIVFSSEKIISMFYKGIGQARITASKREKAREVYKKLRADKFSREEIGFAVHWTIENANEKPYDFALLLDTIGQAVAAKTKADSKKEKAAERQKAVDTQFEELERQESERDDWEFYKADMGLIQREELRQNAIEEIAASGEYQAEFISDILITVKENEILRRERPEEQHEGAPDNEI